MWAILGIVGILIVLLIPSVVALVWLYRCWDVGETREKGEIAHRVDNSSGIG